MTPNRKPASRSDRQLEQAGWIFQDYRQMNISTRLEVAVREFPLPSVAEQKQFVTVVAEKLSQIEAAAKAIDHDLWRATRLHQSILKQAFEGKLVPQDLNDEPASVLLERLRAGRTNANGTISIRKRRLKT